jgi:hypothetical protein
VPDEQFHAVSAWCANGERPGICEHVSEAAVLVPGQISGLTCHVSQITSSAACAREARTAMVEQPSRFVNANSDSYPNGFYHVMNLLASGDVSTSIVAMRIFNGLLAVALLFSLLALAPRTIRQAVCFSWGICLVPLGLFVICSINPSSWTIIAAGLSWAFAYAALQATRKRDALILSALTIVTVAMGASSRVDGAALAVLGVIIGVALSPRGRRLLQAHTAKVSIGIAAAIALLVLALAGTGQWALLTDISADGSNTALLLNNIVEVPQLWIGALGSWNDIWGLGWFDVPLPAAVGVLGVLAYGGALAVGLSQAFHTKSIAILIVAAAITLVPIAFLQTQGVGVGAWVQPRYLLPGMLLLLGIALTNRASTGVCRMSTPQVALLAGSVIFSATFALHRLMRRYITGIDITGWSLDDAAEWWWPSLPSPNAVWIIGSVSYAALVIIAFRMTSRIPKAQDEAL